MDNIPKRVMFAIAYETSFLLALMTGAVAIIAVVQQTVLPIEIK